LKFGLWAAAAAVALVALRARVAQAAVVVLHIRSSIEKI